MSPRPPSQIGVYEILEAHDRGALIPAFSVVGPDSPVDVLRLTFCPSVEDGRFSVVPRPPQVLNTLSHPGIVTYQDLVPLVFNGIEGQAAVFQLPKGKSLTQRSELVGAHLDWEEIRSIFLQCLDILMYTEARGLVHGDIRPSNIWQTSEGEILLLGFEFMRQPITPRPDVEFSGEEASFLCPDGLTQTSAPLDALSDLHNLGLCLFEAIAGRLPKSSPRDRSFAGCCEHWAEMKPDVFLLGSLLQRKRFRFLKKRLEVLPGLSEFLSRAIALDRSRRFASAAEMRAALEDISHLTIQGSKSRYELIEVLGRGGFGKVYKGRSVPGGQVVAIKQLLSSKHAKRFEREAELLAKHPHPHIVSFHEFVRVKVEDGERDYLVMDFLKGMPKASLLGRIREADLGLSAAEVLHYFAYYLSALSYLHERGIIHRDFKPGNLYAPEDVFESKLFDMGVARDADSTLTSGTAPGTLDYMAPEFALVDHFKGSPASDMYAVGLSLYFALTGRPAFGRLGGSRNSPEAVFMQRAHHPKPPAWDHPTFRRFPNVKALVAQAMHPEPERRYSHAGEMLVDVVELLASVGGRAVHLPETVSPQRRLPSAWPEDELTDASSASRPSGFHLEEGRTQTLPPSRKPSRWRWVVPVGLLLVVITGVVGLLFILD